MSTPTALPATPAFPPSESPPNLLPEHVASLVEHVLHRLGRARPPAALRDAVLEALVVPATQREDGAKPTSWEAALLRALRRVGLRATTLRGTLETAVGSAAPSRPVVGLVTIEGASRLAALVERSGSQVVVSVAGETEPRACAIATLAEATGGAESDWLLVDDAAPFALAETDGHGHGPSPTERLLSLVKAERHDLGAVVVYALFLGLFTLTLPVAVQALVSTVAFGTLLQPLVVLTALLLGALVFSATLRGAQTYLVEILQRRAFVRVVADLSHRLPRVSRGAFDRVDGPELVNRFFDTFTVQKALASLLLDGLELVLTVAVGMLVLAFYHPYLLALDVVLIIAVAGIVLGMGRRGPSTAIDESASKYAVAAWLEELARHGALFKLGGGLRYAELRAETLARDYLAQRERHFLVVFRQTIAVLALQAFANAAVLGLGGWLVIGRQLTLGQLVAAELIVTLVVASLAKIGKHLESYYDLLAAIDKLGYLVDLPTEREGGVPCSRAGLGGAALEVVDVHAAYSGGSEVLSGVSLRVGSGQRVGITGPAGAGKSLLVELVAALREPSSGSIRVEGLDVRDLDLSALRSTIAVVRPEVVSGTVLDNVRLGRADVDPSRVRRALEEVGLHAAIEALPEGLSTELTSTGTPLTSSQVLRLAIARAIVANPALLVLDETVDQLDPSAREPLLDTLFARGRAWTLVLTSNDPKVLSRCDAVVALEDGRLRDVRAAQEGKV